MCIRDSRYPVQTYVLEKNDSVIRDAVLREMERGGQIYYLYNKVDTIDQKVSELQELIPEASIGYVHGQMSEIQLENTLLDFIEGQYDILVTTTIIETGVDIPNANTLFIENADHMGLSTLYQLRGRVGRSNRIAYAYLMYRPEKSISEVSEKRLEADVYKRQILLLLLVLKFMILKSNLTIFSLNLRVQNLLK